MSFSGWALLGAVVTAAVGLLTALVLYTLQQRASRAAQALIYVKEQLSELYGPVYVHMAATQHLYTAFRLQHHPDVDSYFDSQNEYKEGEVAICKAYDKATSGEKVVEILRNKSHLIIEDQMPSCIPLYMAHCFGYDAADFLKKEHKWPISATLAKELYQGIVPFPIEFLEYFRASFLLLKRQHRELLHIEEAPLRSAIDGLFETFQLRKRRLALEIGGELPHQE